MTHRVDGAKHELAGQYSARVRATCAGSNQELASATGVDECTSKKALIRSGFGVSEAESDLKSESAGIKTDDRSVFQHRSIHRSPTVYDRYQFAQSGSWTELLK